MNPANLKPPWPRGVSGNPHGRPAGLVSAIRKQTRDGAELVRFFCAVFRDEQVDLDDRMTAATWLADRAFGKPSQMLGLELGEVMIPASQLEQAAQQVTDKLARYTSRDGDGDGQAALNFPAGGKKEGPSEGTVPDNGRMNSGDPHRPVDYPATAQDQGSLHERLDRLMRGDSP
jgi:hypothetical protein